ncbi:Chitinase 1 [Haplosporangium sp. Z 767]|nr:Chitinase 1 [Haplosporangium sp. Z 767]KAF9193879.1 Chitinase 1 [Haplosporangium sp. Z 11]
MSLIGPVLTNAFNPNADNNLVNYWGQKQKPLADYCQTSDIEDVIVMAFLHVFNSASRELPRIDLSNQCDQNSVFPGTSLLHCPQTGAGVKMCQSKGKVVILSLGGAAGAYGFSNDQEARDFAHTIWDLFLGGSSPTRPLDDAILDGVDLDIEGGSTAGYPAFIEELRTLYATDSRKQYYISAAPQCPYPDAYLGPTLQKAWVDMVFVQYYNNYCGAQGFGSLNFNFEQWNNWAKTVSTNKNVKVYLGIPASRTAANTGYVGPEKLREIMDAVRCKYSSFGGIMMWDMSQAYGNVDDTGTQYNAAASQNLKRPRHLVCQDPDHMSDPILQQESISTVDITLEILSSTASSTPQRTQALSSISTSALTLSTVPTLPTKATMAENTLTKEATVVPTTAAYASTTVVMNIPPESLPFDDEDNACPVEGDECVTPPPSLGFICDGYKFAICLNIKSCREMKQGTKDMKAMRQQMKEAISRMWGVFDDAMDATWARYIGLQEDQRLNDEPQLPASGLQHPFIVPPLLVGENIDSNSPEDSESYLIDFTELDTSQEFVGFEVHPDIQNSTLLRTQVRIRTNGGAITPLWQVSFNVQQGVVVQASSRGTFRQEGLRVIVTSVPSQEAELSMVVRFVIEGTRALSMDGAQDGFGAASLPDPASAAFETLQYPEDF